VFFGGRNKDLDDDDLNIRAPLLGTFFNSVYLMPRIVPLM
jgi:hypothetical protein